ncbi:hypothetical protein BGZ61DRAFT_460749, partial [Ilyonectria robusta]|uniref:uncharacterized protein n=1 Tax=Ilyonectria robusta TaxID=1079257 RepID=UPI001E8CE422
MQVVTRRPAAAKMVGAGRDRVATRRRHAALVLDWLGRRTENSIDSFRQGVAVDGGLDTTITHDW